MARVLVVDDEPGWRIVVRHVLESCGHDVDEAADGAAALELVRLTDPDLIVSDVRMPAMSGEELVDRLRSEPSTAGIPIVIMSAQVPGGVHADAVLQKPFRPSAVLEAVNALLSHSAAC